MSHVTNQEWVAAAYENFSEAVSLGNIELAKDIIQDTHDSGFTDEAKKMNEELIKAIASEEKVV